jgi:hypothetical protein
MLVVFTVYPSMFTGSITFILVGFVLCQDLVVFGWRNLSAIERALKLAQKLQICPTTLRPFLRAFFG